MEEERLWKFKRPDWLNSVLARNSGIYAAGGLVRHAHALYPVPWPRRQQLRS